MKKLSIEFKTILLICLALVVCYLKFHSLLFILVAFALFFAALVFKPFAAFIHKWWMKLAWLLAGVMQPLILGTLYFLFLTPLALLQRLTSKNSIQFKNKSASTFNQVKKQFASKHFENPW